MNSDVRADPRLWLDRHGDALFRFALSRTGNRTAAEDLVQETFLAGLSAAGRFEGRSSERTWLIGILKHHIGDYYRRLERGPGRTDSEGEQVESAFSPRRQWNVKPTEWTAAPDADLESAELRAALATCLTKLPPRLGRIVALRELAGLETEQVRQETGLTATHIWTLLYRARLLLRGCLEKSGFAAGATRGRRPGRKANEA
jgi:RNA polymerase sigma-70 factor (ECF subfamily)